jgi:hypothetical protein
MHCASFSVPNLTSGLRCLYFHWGAARQENNLPKLIDIDLCQDQLELDRLVVTEVLRDILGRIEDFRFLFVATAKGKKIREPLCGHRLSELPGKGPDSQMWAAYKAICERNTPLRVSLPYVGDIPGIKKTEELFLPLSSDGESLDLIINGVILKGSGTTSRSGGTN